MVEWLARHPDFFEGREGLLQQLKVPHPETRGATSLLERLVHDLRGRADPPNGAWRQLLESARLTRLSIGAPRAGAGAARDRGNDDLGQALATQLSERFHTPSVALWCPASLSDGEPPPQAPRQVLDAAAETRLSALLDGRASRCARLSVTDWKRLLPHTKVPEKAGSCALTRLTLGEPLGYLVLASPDPDHFRASIDTLFTEYLGEVVSRLLVRHAPATP